jgi:hypothetical protein
MTRHHDFKKLVRERMKKTGESYTTARAHLLQSGDTAGTEIPGLFRGYGSFGGICRDTGSLRNVLAAAGVAAPHTKREMSEALVTGLCGGIGFLYAVFEYKGWPPMLSVMCRFDTMPNGYVAGGIERLGLSVKVSETTSATAARKALDAAIAAGKPALCVVDMVGLAPPGTGGPMAMAGMAPTVVAVAGVDGDELLVDDGAVAPRRMSHADLARARSLYKKGKNRLVTVEGASGLDVAAAVRGAIAATAKRYFDAPYKGFASNFGFAGMEKWRRLLTDPKDKKGWPALFPEGRLAYLALRRTFDGIETDFTAPAAGRPLYAEFLGEAAAITGDDAYATAATLYRRAGDGWRALSGAIASCGDAAVEKGCTLGDSACELFDQTNCDRMGETARIASERTALAQSCKLTRDGAAAIYADLATKLGEIVAVEREAVAALEAVRG